MYSRNDSRNRLILFFFVVVSILLITLYYRGQAKGVVDRSQRLIMTAVVPLQEGVNTLLSPLRRVKEYTLVVGRLTRENRPLKERSLQLKRQIARLRKHAVENRRLQRLAGFRQKFQQQTVAARVISRSPTGWQSLITIDVGESDGIRKDMPVVTDKGLVGRVIQVSTAAAFVQLLDDRRSGVSVEIARTGKTAIAEGSIDGTLRLRFVPADMDIREGDKLVASGVGGVYPRGLAVGTVAQVARTSYSLERKITVKPAETYTRLSEVIVITERRRTGPDR